MGHRVLLRLLLAVLLVVGAVSVLAGCVVGVGPVAFALDTGASNTVVDLQVADQLGLERTGRRQQVTGVVGQQVVEIARVDRWQLGDVPLDPGDVAVLDLPDPEQGRGLQGLIGSDVLSRFDYVVVDYDDRRLGLPPA
jgi:predicted aspartyl protease